MCGVIAAPLDGEAAVKRERLVVAIMLCLVCGCATPFSSNSFSYGRCAVDGQSTVLGCVNNFNTGASGIEAQTLVRTSHSWDGAVLPSYPTGSPEITMLRITIPPGVQLPLHKHPVINAGLLLSGELTVIAANGDQLHLTAGQPIVEVVNTWHYGKNEGKGPAEIVVFYAGRSGLPITEYSDDDSH